MKKIFFSVVLNLILFSIFAQSNLVPNPSFETLETCPYLGSQLYFAYPWFVAEGSPDLYNTCATLNNWSVPFNQFGFQNPHSGNGYAGGVFYNVPSSDYREYLEVQLDSTLIANENYCVSFYVSLSSGLLCVGSNNVGMYFSTTPRYSPILLSNLIPQINYTSIISDTTKWTLIKGQFVAQGGERYIIIGNFIQHNLVDTVHFPNGSNNDASYFYVDDIDVHRGICEEHLNISDIKKDESITISPNPFALQTTITFAEEQTNTTIKIISVLGKEVKILNLTGRQLTIEKGTLQTGAYFVQITDDQKHICMRKIIIQ
jgi:hypothetical protein